MCDAFYNRLKVEMCTYLQSISNNYIEKGVSQKVNRRWISNRRWAVSKWGGSESQQKMNIQQEVPGPCQKRGRIRNVNWDLTRKTWVSIIKSTAVNALFWHGPPPVGYSSSESLDSDSPLFQCIIVVAYRLEIRTHLMQP